MQLIDQDKGRNHSSSEEHREQEDRVKNFLPTKFFFDIGYATSKVTSTEMTVNASEYRKELINPRQIISFSSTLRYASMVQSFETKAQALII